MKANKKIFRWVAWLILSPIVFVLVFVILAFTIGLIPVNNHYQPLEKGILIFIRTNGVHTDIVLPTQLPTKDWRQIFPTKTFESVASKPAYIAFGLGEKAFYTETPTWDDLSASTAFNALFLPTQSAMHVSYLAQMPIENESCKSLWISNKQYQVLQQFIMDTYVFKNQQVQLLVGKNYGYHDNFYEAKPSYHLFYTCNDWTNEALKQMGVKTAWWSPFDKGIMWYR